MPRRRRASSRAATAPAAVPVGGCPRGNCPQCLHDLSTTIRYHATVATIGRVVVLRRGRAARDRHGDRKYQGCSRRHDGRRARVGGHRAFHEPAAPGMGRGRCRRGVVVRGVRHQCRTDWRRCRHMLRWQGCVSAVSGRVWCCATTISTPASGHSVWNRYARSRRNRISDRRIGFRAILHRAGHAAVQPGGRPEDRVGALTTSRRCSGRQRAGTGRTPTSPPS